MRLFLTLLLCLVGLDLQAQALWRNFFTTNQTPIVDVVAGSNATVVATTPNVFTRRFTVSSTATGGGTATNVYGTNVIGAVSEASHATNADSSTYAGTATNANYVTTATITNQVYGSNVVGAVSQASHATNADSATYAGTATNAQYVTAVTLTNQVYGSNVTGAVSEASHATNADSATYAGTATNANFVLTSVLTNRIYATNVVSGGQLPAGTVATNTAFLTNAFLKEDGVNRYWSFDGASLTNVPFSIFTNYAVGPTAFTNVNGFGYAMDTYGMTNYWEFATVASVGPVAILHSGIDTNTVITTNGGSFRGAILDLSASASAPASNQLVTAGWTRNLLTAANIPYYATTNIDTGATNVGTSQLTYKYESAIPLPSARSYAAAFLTNDGYLGAVITTNTFQELSGGVLVAPVVGWAGGTGTRSFTYKAELYVSSDKTNWYGDWSSGTITLGANTTNYTPLLVDVPRTVATNAAGFYLQRRLKITSITYGGSPSVWVLVGTNSLTGASDAAHISLPNPTSTAGNAYLAANQTFTGTNTFSTWLAGNGGGLTNLQGSNLVGTINATLVGTITNGIDSTNVTITGPSMLYGSSARTNGVYNYAGGQVLSNANGSVTIAGGNVTASGTFTGSGSGLSNLSATVAVPSEMIASYDTLFGLSNYWRSGEQVVIADSFRGTAINNWFTTATASGGAAAATGGATYSLPNSWWYRASAYPTNTASRGALTGNQNNTLLSSLFALDGMFVVDGVEGVEHSVGLRLTHTGATPTQAILWIANTNNSANWVAQCTASSSSTYWTSSLPITVGSQIRLSILASTNSATFYTNGIAASTITQNVPFGQSLIWAMRSLSLSTNGAATSQGILADWIWTTVR